MPLDLGGLLKSWAVMKFTRNVSWPKMPSVATLIEWKQPARSQTYEEYKEQARNYEWFLWRDFEGQALENELRRRFNSYCGYHELFEGCCLLGDNVQIIPTNDVRVIIFSKNWKGEFSDHSDLDLHMSGASDFPFCSEVSHSVTIYSSGTRFVPRGGIEERFGGEPPGYHKIWHKRRQYDLKLDNWNTPTILALHDEERSATFRLGE